MPTASISSIIQLQHLRAALHTTVAITITKSSPPSQTQSPQFCRFLLQDLASQALNEKKMGWELMCSSKETLLSTSAKIIHETRDDKKEDLRVIPRTKYTPDGDERNQKL